MYATAETCLCLFKLYTHEGYNNYPKFHFVQRVLKKALSKAKSMP